MHVAGLLLAAGTGRRFGSPKALVPLGGKLFVESAAELLTAAGCDPVVVVLGAQADVVRAKASLDGVTVVDNPDWDTGMGSSLRTGLHAIGIADAVVVLPVDTPGVTVAALHRLTRRRIYVHINNTNPILVDGSPERLQVERHGWEVAEDGMEIVL